MLLRMPDRTLVSQVEVQTSKATKVRLLRWFQSMASNLLSESQDWL